jgi:uncharacterized membrane protein YdjX (TVP38/TMEM64 family)
MQYSEGKARRVILLVLLLAGVAWVFFNYSQFNQAKLETWIGGTGVYAPLAYVVAATMATVLMVPGSLFVFVGGVLFGPLGGTCYSLFGATLGAGLAFLIARYIASDWVARESKGKLKKLIEGVESEGWRFVAFVRLVPIIPFSPLSYALGLTRIRYYHYLIATFICSIPGITAISYLGYVGKETLAGGDALIEKSFIAIGLLAIMAYLPRFVKRLHDKEKGLDQSNLSEE